jgi:hypothetical protein
VALRADHSDNPPPTCGLRGIMATEQTELTQPAQPRSTELLKCTGRPTPDAIERRRFEDRTGPMLCDNTLFQPVFELPNPPVTGVAIKGAMYACTACGAVYKVAEGRITHADATTHDPQRLARAFWQRVK